MNGTEGFGQVLDVIGRRSSTRVFTGRDVSDEQRRAVLDALARAPSAGAMMLYSVIDIREQATLDRLAVLCDNQPFVAKAPWALVFVADWCKWLDMYERAGCFEGAGVAARRAPGMGDLLLACEDAMAAAQTAVIAAEAVGLGSCYIGDILENAEDVSRLLDLPEHTLPLSMLVVGEPASNRPPTPHATENLVMPERYRRASPEVLDRQLVEQAGTARQAVPGDRVRALFRRKHTAAFMEEMNRSAEEWVRRWKG